MSALDLIPAGHTFTPEEITAYADPERRSLEQALAEADVLISAPTPVRRSPKSWPPSSPLR